MIVDLEYFNFVDVLSLEFVAELFKYMIINNYAIKLIVSQKLTYGPIYS